MEKKQNQENREEVVRKPKILKCVCHFFFADNMLVIQTVAGQDAGEEILELLSGPLETPEKGGDDGNGHAYPCPGWHSSHQLIQSWSFGKDGSPP